MKFTLPSEELYDILSSASGYHEEAVFKLKEDKILIRVQDESQTALYSSLIPGNVLSEYKKGEHPRIGFYIEETLKALPNDDTSVTVELDGPRILLSVGSREYRTPNIDPDAVNSEPDTVPKLDLPVEIYLNPDKLLSFIDDAARHVYSSDSGYYFIRAQEGAMYLWSKKDDYEISDYFHWEDFDDYDIDWKNASGMDNMPGNPIEEKRISAILAIPLTKPISPSNDIVKMEMGHGMPLKMVSESDAGVKHSWIVPPRFPTNSQASEIPERIIKDRNVV